LILSSWLNVGCAKPPCPTSADRPLRFVDVFDGPPEEMALLLPDVAAERSGRWDLAYVYKAGRFVSIRCKYADGPAIEVKITQRIRECRYALDVNRNLSVNCK
jgi:hypothetical protein